MQRQKKTQICGGRHIGCSVNDVNIWNTCKLKYFNPSKKCVIESEMHTKKKICRPVVTQSSTVVPHICICRDIYVHKPLFMV